MNASYYGMVYQAKNDVLSHDEDCEECRVLGRNGDLCPEGSRLLARARDLYESLRDPPDDDRRDA